MKTFATALLCVSAFGVDLGASTTLTATTGATAEIESVFQTNKILGAKGIFGGIGGRKQGEFSSEGPTDYGSTDSHSYDSYLSDGAGPNGSDYISSDAGSDGGLPNGRILDPYEHFFNDAPRKRLPDSELIPGRTVESLTIFDNAYEGYGFNQYTGEPGYGNFYRGGHPVFGDDRVNPLIAGHGGLYGQARFGRGIGPDGYVY